jgi:Bacterial PH domain
MDGSWRTSLVQWLVWGLAMSLVMGWVARSRLRRTAGADSLQLAHPPSTLVIGLVGFVFFAGLAVVSNVYANPTTSIWTTLTFVALAMLALPMVADYFFARHVVSAQGMDFGRMSGRRGRFDWSEVRQVTFSPAMKWFRLELADGRIVRVSAMLAGLPPFARLLLDHVVPEAIHEEALPILQATAEGRPPAV